MAMKVLSQPLPACPEMTLPKMVLVVTPPPSWAGVSLSIAERAGVNLTWFVSSFNLEEDPVTRWGCEKRFSEQAAWELVCKYLRRRRSLWIMSLGARRVLNSQELLCEVARGFTTPVCWIDDDPPTVATLIRRGCAMHVVDLRNYVALDFTKLVYQWNQTMPFRRTGRHWVARTYEDMEALHEVSCACVSGILQCCQEQLQGCWGHSAAAIGEQFWRNRFYKVRVFQTETLEAADMEQRALYGGRVELFRIGHVPGPVTRLDMVSHYPTTALSVALPRRPTEMLSVSPGGLRILMDAGSGAVAHVRVNTRELPAPVRIKGQPVWAIGNFNTHLAGQELHELLDSGAIEKVHRVCLYEQDHVWDDVTAALLRARQDAKASGLIFAEALIKRANVGLYGRTIRRKTVYDEAVGALPARVVGQWRVYKAATKRVYNMRRIGPRTEFANGTLPHPRSCVHLGASLFSAARHRMDVMIEIAGRDNVYMIYCDSLHVSAAGRERLAHTTEPGHGMNAIMRVENSGDSADYWGINHFRVGTTLVRSNAPKITISGIEFYDPARQVFGQVTGEVDYAQVDGTTFYLMEKFRQKHLAGSIDRSGRIHPYELYDGKGD